jgi:sporulation protein YlmC with PRC-barrel domain
MFHVFFHYNYKGVPRMSRSRFTAACLALIAAGAMPLVAIAQQPNKPDTPPERATPPARQPDALKQGAKNNGDPMRIAAILREKNVRLTKAIETAEDETDGIAISAKTRMVPTAELRNAPARDTRPDPAQQTDRIPAVIVCCVDKNDAIKFVTIDLASGDVVKVQQASLSELDDFDARPGARAGGAATGSAMILKGDELIGRNVVNHEGETLGEIHDLALDPDSGRIAYAVLSSGGVLGVGDKLYAIPWQALSRHHSDEGCLLDVDKERLQNAPGFTSDKWPNMADQRWASDVNTFYKVDSQDFKPRRIVKASEVMGRDVHNTQDEDIGGIENLAIDGSQGRVQYAVLSFGGVLGVGDKHFAIPWDALRMNTEGDKYIVAIDKDRLKNAPGFDKNNWPDMANEQWGRQVRDFYRGENRPQ